MNLCPRQESRSTFTFRAEEEDKGWQIVTKGRKGRPTQLSTAAKAYDQTRLGIKRRRRESNEPAAATDRNDEEMVNTSQEDSQVPATQES